MDATTSGPTPLDAEQKEGRSQNSLVDTLPPLKRWLSSKKQRGRFHSLPLHSKPLEKNQMANPKNTKLFVAASHSNAVAIVTDTAEIGPMDGIPGNPIGLKFATVRGKGTGGQFVPVDQLPAFIEALSHYADPANLVGADAATDVVSTLRATIGYDDSVEVADGEEFPVTFRVSSGKGQKPTRLMQSEIGPVCELLTSWLPMINQRAASLAKAAKK